MARQVSRPDGDFDYSYDQGRLHSVTLPAIAGGTRPSVTYGYDDTLGVVQTVTHTQNGVIEYGYNKATRGTLPLSETWRITSGGVETTRSVSWTHDSLARIASWTVEGGPSVSVSYDGDGMLSGVGTMSVERDPTAGTEQGTTLTSGGGTVATTQRYNAYGEVVSRGSPYGLASMRGGGPPPLRHPIRHLIRHPWASRNILYLATSGGGIALALRAGRDAQPLRRVREIARARTSGSLRTRRDGARAHARRALRRPRMGA